MHFIIFLTNINHSFLKPSFAYAVVITTCLPLLSKLFEPQTKIITIYCQNMIRFMQKIYNSFYQTRIVIIQQKTSHHYYFDA